MTMDDDFLFLQEKGPEGLLGAKLELFGEPYEVVSIAGVGDEMIVYNLRNMRTLQEDRVIKIPRNPSTSPQKHVGISRWFYLVMERFSQFIERALHAAVSRDESSELVEQGIAALGNGSYETAVELFQKALEIDPLNKSALHNKGVAFCYLERFEEALGIFERLIEQDSKDTDALVNKGEVLYRKGNYEDAFEYYKKALLLNAKDTSAWLGLGKTAGTCGDFERALACFQQVLKLDPLNREASKYLEQTQEYINRKTS